MLLGVFHNGSEAVCQEHLQIATMGVYPGFSTFNMATNGFGCSIEIEIVPVPPSTGGGGGWRDTTVWYPDQNYEIIVRVKYKDKTWEERKLISALMAKSLEKVFASFRRINMNVVQVFAKINTILKKDITVKAFWRK